ncbi:hypothetical protein WJ978_14930 [Achromobacter xylosoxidans]
MFVVLAVPFAFYGWVQTAIWQIERESDRREAARNVTLEAPTTVAGIVMPAGTRLKLQDEGQLETYVEAEFAQPVAMYGVQGRARSATWTANTTARPTRCAGVIRVASCCAARAARRCWAGSATLPRTLNSTWRKMARWWR